MSRQQLAGALARLPSDPLDKTEVFIETVRAIDYWSVFQHLLPPEKRLAPHDFQIIEEGWNLAAAHLLTPLQVRGMFPLRESTQETRSYALGLLHQFGRAVLMRRCSDMIKSGLMAAERAPGGFVVRCTAETPSQLLDHLEHDWLKKEQGLPSPPPELRDRVRPDIDSLMRPLIRPRDTGRGVMVTYGALPEVDDHFMAEALAVLSDWRVDAGIHPDVCIDGIRGADILTMAAVVLGLHIKHLKFSMLALADHPNISMPQSLTIWSRRGELAESIEHFAGLDRKKVETYLDAITMKQEDLVHLAKRTSPFRPMLIELGNEVLLRPISCLMRNSLHSVRALHEWRSPSAKSALSVPREEWLRSELYALFQGNRYSLVEGPTKLREKSELVTDIDCAILDTITGELALFQLKWQDFDTNDVLALRSKAKNFCAGMDLWADAVSEWIVKHGSDQLATVLRIPRGGRMLIKNVRLFGLSRMASRMNGYGYSTRNQQLALANWPQFLRLRLQIGSADNVFLDIHQALRTDMRAPARVRPVPVSILVGEAKVEFCDLWMDAGRG